MGALLPSVVYNVWDYGAVGDGEVDDTVPVQLAINAAYAAGGGSVLVPSGRFRITDSLIFRGKYLKFSGMQAGATAIFNDSSGPAIVCGFPDDESRAGAEGLVLQDFAIFGGDQGAEQHGIYAGRVWDKLIVSRVRIGDNSVAAPPGRGRSMGLGPGGHGIYVKYSTGVQIEDCTITYCDGSGVALESGQYPGINASRVVGVSSRENMQHGLWVAGPSEVYQLQVVGGTLESNARAGFFIERGMSLVIEGVHVEDNGERSFLGAYDVTVKDMQISPDNYGIYVAGQTTRFENCAFSSHSPLVIEGGNRGVSLINCLYSGPLAECIIDHSSGLRAFGLQQQNGNQDSSVNKIPQYRAGLELLADEPGASERGVLMRLEGNGSRQDRLLYGRGRAGFPRNYDWIDLDTIVNNGPLGNVVFDGPEPAVGTLGFDRLNDRFCVKTDAGWKSVALESGLP